MNEKSKDETARTRLPETKLVTGGRDPRSYHGFVNPPVYHASTVLYPNAEDFLAHRARYQYGRRGTPTTEALESALQELEGPQCAGVALLPSGLAAISTAFVAVVHAGDHALVTDSAYGPTRIFCDQVLSRLGVTVTYYDPLIGAAIAGLLKPNTRVVYLESPGSLSFEMQDTAAIAKAVHDKAAHEKGTLVLMDNTWATPFFFRPLEHGVDMAIQAGTKYIGHGIWKRDFTGASGLFSMVLKPVRKEAYHAFLDVLELFGIGASWGGYESLAIPFDCAPLRTATRWQPGGPTVRFHIGLEAVDDLISDLERGFAALAAASR